LAAKELNRKFIGIEKEPKYYEIAKQRIFNYYDYSKIAVNDLFTELPIK
jgi:DNA modification methylase